MIRPSPWLAVMRKASSGWRNSWTPNGPATARPPRCPRSAAVPTMPVQCKARRSSVSCDDVPCNPVQVFLESHDDGSRNQLRKFIGMMVFYVGLKPRIRAFGRLISTTCSAPRTPFPATHRQIARKAGCSRRRQVLPARYPLPPVRRYHCPEKWSEPANVKSCGMISWNRNRQQALGGSSLRQVTREVCPQRQGTISGQSGIQ